MSADSKKAPDLGCATATPLELKLLQATKAWVAAEDDAAKEAAYRDYAAILADYLKSSGQLVDKDILRPLTGDDA